MEPIHFEVQNLKFITWRLFHCPKLKKILRDELGDLTGCSSPDSLRFGRLFTKNAAEYMFIGRSSWRPNESGSFTSPFEISSDLFSPEIFFSVRTPFRTNFSACSQSFLLTIVRSARWWMIILFSFSRHSTLNKGLQDRQSVKSGEVKQDKSSGLLLV